MNRGLWYLFSREVKVPSLVLGGFILLGFAFSWVLATYGIFGCLIFIYFRLRDRIQKIYCFFIFLSEELVYRKRLNLTEEEKAVFLYNPCPFLIKRYCNGMGHLNVENIDDGKIKKPWPSLLNRLNQMSLANFKNMLNIIRFFEMILPILIGIIAIMTFQMEFWDGMILISMMYVLPMIPGRGRSKSLKDYWGYLNPVEVSDVKKIIDSNNDFSEIKWKPHYQQWRKRGWLFLNSTPLMKENENIEDFVEDQMDGSDEQRLSSILENPDNVKSEEIYDWINGKRRKEKFGELTTAFQNNELTAKQIYDQIDEKIEAANLTAQELWELWAEYYFEGYEPLKKIE